MHVNLLLCEKESTMQRALTSDGFVGEEQRVPRECISPNFSRGEEGEKKKHPQTCVPVSCCKTKQLLEKKLTEGAKEGEDLRIYIFFPSPNLLVIAHFPSSSG